MKRLFDIFWALAGLIVLSPLLLVAWFGILLTSGRPGIFRQVRVGKGGNSFILYKFRTMSVLQGSEKGSFDAGSTSRITPVGKILRKTKIDELPQLWNVARGDMSLVGPRPEVEKWVRVYPERWAKVLTVRPGITDNASIEFRDEEDILAASDDPEKTYREEVLPRKLDYYESYAENHSITGDFYILFKTVKAVLRIKTA